MIPWVSTRLGNPGGPIARPLHIDARLTGGCLDLIKEDEWDSNVHTEDVGSLRGGLIECTGEESSLPQVQDCSLGGEFLLVVPCGAFTSWLFAQGE